MTDDIAGNVIAHAILGAVVAELQGGPSIAGGVGAVAGELAAKLIREQLYGKDVKDLTEAEKQNISALAQLAAGLAIAAGGGDTGAAGAAMAAGKNAVENNAVSLAEGGTMNGFIGMHHDTAAQYDSILHASANNYLTAEETEQALSGLIKGKGMPNGSDYAELWMRAPEQIGQYLPGPIGIAMEILALADVAITNTDKANLVQLLTEASKDHLSGLDNSESMAALDMMISRLAAGSKNKQLQGIIKRNVESNVAKNQKGNASSKFGEHVKNENQLTENWNNTNQAHNVNNYEKYKDKTISQMEKPIVKDKQLQGLFDDLYRENAKIGSGSTADAVRHELSTGQSVGGKTHSQKAEDYSRALQDWIKRNPTAPSGDRAAAENVLKDLQNALKGK